MEAVWCWWKRNLVTKLIVCYLLCCPLYAEVYNISESLPCETEPCTLTHLATLPSHNLNSNITLILSPEVHNLSLNLLVSNITNFSIIGSSIGSQETVIACNGTGLRFYHVQNILISSITFQGCGENIVKQVNRISLENSAFLGTIRSRTALVLNETIKASMYRCSFQSNTLGLTYDHMPDLSTYYHDNDSVRESVGGALIVSNSSLEISHSTFQGNSAGIGSAVFTERSSMINISESVFLFNNDSLQGPGHTLFAIDDCLIDIHNSTFLNNTGQHGVFGVVNSWINVNFSSFSFNGALLNDGGVITAFDSFLQITECIFSDNFAQIRGGVVHTIDTDIYIRESTFNNNRAGNLGGTLHLIGSSIAVLESNFTNSRAREGGTVYAISSRIWISEGCNFNSNRAESYGGVALITDSSLDINGSTFANNSAEEDGGVLGLSLGCNVTICQSTFENSVAKKGGVIHTYSGTLNATLLKNRATINGGDLEVTDLVLNVYRCSFKGNVANSGAVVDIFYCSANIDASSFSENSARYGVLETTHCNVELYNLTVTENLALFAGMYIFQSIAHFTGLTIIENNIGSMYAFDSYVHFIGNLIIRNCSEPMSLNQTSFKGGGFTSYRSVISLNGTTLLTHNQARRGGGFIALESFINIYGDTTIHSNKAVDIGGGAYVYQSDFTVQDSSCIFTSNEAEQSGGGIHAISSLVTTSSGYEMTHLDFVNNTAIQGGGVYLEANSKLYVLKRQPELTEPQTKVRFVKNQGRMGGAIYVADETNSRTCAATTECFFQILSLHMEPSSNFNTVNIFFSQNLASKSGNDIFGGVLDRCLPSTFAEIHQLEDNDKNDNGLSYIANTSNVILDSIASFAVRVCFCVNSFPDCNYIPQSKTVKKGEKFAAEVVAVDQVGHPLRTNITISFKSTESTLLSGHISQFVNDSCTNLSFSIKSPHRSEKLDLHPDGPCNSKQYSKAAIPIQFAPCTCPIGFDSIVTTTICKCMCASVLSPRVTDCQPLKQSFIKSDASWISYTNKTEPNGYIIHSHCPFDYCLPHSSSVRINLNMADGADGQCNHNRRGILCGGCKESYSLSLGSTRCIECPSHWPAFLVSTILFVIIIGVAFVAAILFLNLTVAIGTLNAIIFYVNIIHLQHSVYFPDQGMTYQATVVAWLNLDLRIDLCFYKGMDAYLKTWLRLMFPAYIILLVALVIMLSKCSSKFANFIGKRDPVATLATLILLSYTRLLDFFVESLVFTTLNLPDGSVHVLWLLDANVNYFLSKHAPLFIVTLVILLICLVFTLLLLLWQWIVKLFHKCRGLSFIRSPKFASFIETYQIPFHAYARYWTGLLLLVRVILYLVTILNFNRNPHVQLTATAFVVGALLTIKGLYTKPVYRKSLLDVMETIIYFNIIAFTAFTAYTLESNGNQVAVATVSTSVTLIMLIAVIAYHVYTYTCIGRLLRKLDCHKRLLNKLRPQKQKRTLTTNSNPTEPQVALNYLDMSKYRNSIFETMEQPTDGEYLQLQQQSEVRNEQSLNHSHCSTPVPPVTSTTVQLSNKDTETTY